MFKAVHQGTNNPEPIKNVFSHFTGLIKNELNDEPYSNELKACTKMHFWRRIKYETRLRVKDSDVEQSLNK